MEVIACLWGRRKVNVVNIGEYFAITFLDTVKEYLFQNQGIKHSLTFITFTLEYW